MKTHLWIPLCAGILVTAPSLARADLASAVDNPTVNGQPLVWTAGGPGGWGEDPAYSHSHGLSARSGPLGDSQANHLEALVQGPGTISFFWRVQSMPGDTLIFRMNGAGAASISGNVWWHQMSFVVPAGLNVLQWQYAKDAAGADPVDAAWLDEVVFYPADFRTVALAQGRSGMPTPRLQCGAGTVSGMVYTFGGWNGMYLTATEEYNPGVGCVVAPVHDHEGQIIAALTVSGPAERIDEKLDGILAQVTAHAAAISEELGYRSTG